MIIGENVKIIDENVFLDTIIDSVDFSKATNLESIKRNAFNNAALAIVDLSNCTKLTELGIAAFVNNPLENISLPNTILNIGTGCFASTNIQSLDLSELSIYVLREAFAGCKNLKNVKLPKTLRRIEGIHMFGGCEQLQSIELPRLLKSLGGCTFENCISLKSVNIPPKIHEIPFECFRGCKNLEKVELPMTIDYVGKDAFTECDNLIEIKFYGREEDLEDFDPQIDIVWQTQYPEKLISITGLSESRLRKFFKMGYKKGLIEAKHFSKF